MIPAAGGSVRPLPRSAAAPSGVVQATAWRAFGRQAHGRHAHRTYPPHPPTHGGRVPAPPLRRRHRLSPHPPTPRNVRASRALAPCLALIDGRRGHQPPNGGVQSGFLVGAAKGECPPTGGQSVAEAAAAAAAAAATTAAAAAVRSCVVSLEAPAGTASKEVGCGRTKSANPFHSCAPSSREPTAPRPPPPRPGALPSDATLAPFPRRPRGRRARAGVAPRCQPKAVFGRRGNQPPDHEFWHSGGA